MDSLIFELQIVFYFQLFLSANVRHILWTDITLKNKKTKPSSFNHIQFHGFFLIIIFLFFIYLFIYLALIKRRRRRCLNSEQ